MFLNTVAETLNILSRVPIIAIKLTWDGKFVALSDTQIILFHVKVGHLR